MQTRVSNRFPVILALLIPALLLLASCAESEDAGDGDTSGLTATSAATAEPTDEPEEEETEEPGDDVETEGQSGADESQEEATEEPGDDEETEDQSGADESEWVDYEFEILATNLDIPWELVFLPDGDMFITERPGTVRLFRDGELQDDPILEFDDVVHERGAEGGLLGMTLHPDFEENNWIYFYYTYGEGDEWRNRVVRYEVDGTDFSDRETIIEDLPGAFTHNGGRIKFGPDERLYVTLGDAQRQDDAQDVDVLVAKILRLNDDGSIPDDNPFNDSPVYANGLRNPQGISWHPETGELYANQHGPSGNDEINLIEPGANYGWPDMEGFEGEEKDEFTLPVMASGEDTWAPSGSTFYDGDVFPQWQNEYLMSGLRSVTLYRVDFDSDSEEPELGPIVQGEYGRLRTVVQGPDGLVYLLTSNRDERQEPDEDDDKLIRIIPAE
ncbi:MAG: PQQ-dependent sugar dehydrogenase [Thermomicrobiaceae bacterium]